MVKNAENIIVGVSIGDLNGIGPEVVLKSFEDPRMLELCTPVIFANVKMLSFLRKSFDSTANLHGIDRLDQLIHGRINVLNVWRESFPLAWGELNDVVGKYALKSFTSAVEALKAKHIDVLVTAPLHKYNIQNEEFKFPGHTDYLNQELEGDALMFMVSDELRVGLLTEHIPVTEVSKYVTPGRLSQRIKTLHETLIADFGIRKPKIAVLGLNPHCGDHGVIGKEDDEVIKPTVKLLNEQGILAFGPYAADAFFGNEMYQQFDAVLAMYHDQGLIPFKTLSFGQGVNVTAGLERIRTSPDHGTAFDIAGKNKADASSFTKAVYTAIDLFRNRGQHAEISSNPLVIREKRPESKKM